MSIGVVVRTACMNPSPADVYRNSVVWTACMNHHQLMSIGIVVWTACMNPSPADVYRNSGVDCLYESITS